MLPTTVLNHLTTAVIVIDSELCVLSMNQSAESLFETSSNQQKNQTINKLILRPKSLADELKSVLDQQRSHTVRETQMLLRNGKVLMIDYAVTPIKTAQKTQLVIELWSLNWLLRVNRENAMLAQYQVTKSLMQGLAHEIKNPLGGIRGAAQLLEGEINPELRDYTQVVIREADRLRNLVERMLGAQEAPKLAMGNIHAILEHVITLKKAEHGNRLCIEKNYDPSIPECLLDAEQLQQVFLNIIENAAQSLIEEDIKPGQITVSTRTLRQYTIGTQRFRLVCRVDINDNGPGIPKESQENIFFPMVSGRANGTGLGLSISQSIVKHHDGLIECNSEPGNTTFTVLLPIKTKKS